MKSLGTVVLMKANFITHTKDSVCAHTLAWQNSGRVFAHLRAAQVGKQPFGVLRRASGQTHLVRKWANTVAEGNYWAVWCVHVFHLL